MASSTNFAVYLPVMRPTATILPVFLNIIDAVFRKSIRSCFSELEFFIKFRIAFSQGDIELPFDDADLGEIAA